MRIWEKVKKVLEALPLSSLVVEIEPDNGFKVVAVVTSDDFEKMDEGERQHLVWKRSRRRAGRTSPRRIHSHHGAPSEHEVVRDGESDPPR